MGLIEDRVRESIGTKQKILNDKGLISLIQETAYMMAGVLAAGGKILLCGNGGSASDSLHIAGELVGRFRKERGPLPAIALNADVASMTAIANDYGYDRIFSRAVEGYMDAADLLVGISTSGNSENVYQAFLKAKEIGGRAVALLGRDGGKIKDVVDVAVIVPDDVKARIQEAHIMIGHIICELIEDMM